MTSLVSLTDVKIAVYSYESFERIDYLACIMDPKGLKSTAFFLRNEDDAAAIRDFIEKIKKTS